VTLYSGCGADTGSARYWCNSTAIWNNDGDTLFLRDSVGNTVATYAY
jgi:hypothetical protein